MKYKTLLKIIEGYVEKCETSSKARKRGENAERTTTHTTITYTYPDGTTIVKNKQHGTILSVTIDGKTTEYLGDKAYDEFESQNNKLKETEAEMPLFQNYNWRGGVMRKYEFDTEYDFCKRYADTFASTFGLDLNKKLYAGESLDKWTSEYSTDSPMIITDSEQHTNHFIDLERQNNVDQSDYLAVTYKRELHDSESIDKKAFTAKGFTSTSVGGDTQKLQDTFNNTPGSWTVITTIGKGSGVKGLFLGNMLSDYRYEQYGEANQDWEGELNLPPRTRFARDLVDVENHIIIQHIERQ